MADRKTVELLLQGANKWNAWREAAEREHATWVDANLSDGVTLIGANLIEADRSGALTAALLRAAKLGHAHRISADLAGADLAGANLAWANLRWADLAGADLTGANLSGARLGGARLGGASLQDALLNETIFVNVDLSAVIGVQACKHLGPSIIDFRTLQQSGPLPLAFSRGVGLPDSLIEYLPSLSNRAMYSCFISYSSKDQDFADRLHADIQNKGVRCWFASHDLRIGDNIWDSIDAGIKSRDKLLLILSENSIGSYWVKDEVNRAFDEERDRKQLVLFPLRIDDSVIQSEEPWARKLRERHIGDFRQWELHETYQTSLNRLIRDLTVRKF